MQQVITASAHTLCTFFIVFVFVFFFSLSTSACIGQLENVTMKWRWWWSAPCHSNRWWSQSRILCICQRNTKSTLCSSCNEYATNGSSNQIAKNLLYAKWMKINVLLLKLTKKKTSYGKYAIPSCCRLKCVMRHANMRTNCTVRRQRWIAKWYSETVHYAFISNLRHVNGCCCFCLCIWCSWCGMCQSQMQRVWSINSPFYRRLFSLMQDSLWLWSNDHVLSWYS